MSVSPSQMCSYYQLADVFLCVSEHEGFCVLLVESMYFRAPIVAWAATAVGETCDGCGMVYPEFDAQVLARAVDACLEDPILSRDLTCRGRLRYETVFRPDAIRECFLRSCERGENRPRVAFIVQRYGEQITGRSESHCRQIAERLAVDYDVEVITTCATNHLSWKNVRPAGEEVLNGVRVRRFPSVEERRLMDFHRHYDRIFLTQLSPEEEYEMIRFQGPYTPALVEYVQKDESDYNPRQSWCRRRTTKQRYTCISSTTSFARLNT